MLGITDSAATSDLREPKGYGRARSDGGMLLSLSERESG